MTLLAVQLNVDLESNKKDNWAMNIILLIELYQMKCQSIC